MGKNCSDVCIRKELGESIGDNKKFIDELKNSQPFHLL